MAYSVREALAGFRRAPLLTGLSAGMVGLAIFVVGLFGLVAHNLRLAVSQVESRVEVVAYLRDGADLNAVGEAQDQLRRMPEVLSIGFLSKADALEKARAELPEFQEVFTGLEVNPLPASLEIQLQPGSRDPLAVERVAQAAAAFPFVEDVRYGREWVDRLFMLRRIGFFSALGLGAAFSIVAALIIGAAIRIAIFARREEIYVMRLVGARDSFIRRPFLLEGALTGLLGGLMAVLLTFLTFLSVYRFIFRVEWIPFSWVTAGVGSGMVVGLLASRLAVARYLREIG
jgi:cell division transport system permease protein